MRRSPRSGFSGQRFLALGLGVIVFNCSIVSAMPGQSENDARRTARVKRAVNKIGVDEKISVRLLTGPMVKGQLTEIGDEHFVVVEKKTGDTRTFTFAQVKEVGKTLDNGLSDPRTIMGLAFIPLIVGVCLWARNKD